MTPPSVDLELCDELANPRPGQRRLYDSVWMEDARTQLRALLLERQTQADVLRELVRVERLKDSLPAWKPSAAKRWADYIKSKPLAWQSAFALVDALKENGNG